MGVDSDVLDAVTDRRDQLDRIIDQPARTDAEIDVRDQVMRRIASEPEAETASLPWVSLVVAALGVFCLFAEPVLGGLVRDQGPGLLTLVLDWSVECGLVLLVLVGVLWLRHWLFARRRRSAPR